LRREHRQRPRQLRLRRLHGQLEQKATYLSTVYKT
jgi:hypothetical protein